MTEEKPKKGGWFSKIRDRDDAIKVAKDCGNAFFVLAAIQGVLGVWLDRSILIDAALFAVCGFFIRRSFSRTAAVITLILALITVVTTFMNRIGESVGGGNNILLAVIVLWAAVRSAEATFKLHGRYKDGSAAGQQSAGLGGEALPSAVKVSVPSTVRQSILGLHISFWAHMLGLVVVIIVFSIYDDKSLPTALDAVVLTAAFAIVVGRVAYYVFLWRVVRSLGRSPIIWIGACIFTWPIGDAVAYALIWYSPKEWEWQRATAA